MNIQLFARLGGMNDLPDTDWIAACAHGLHRHWHSVSAPELEAVAAELSHDQRLRAMPPTEAASEWLKPVALGTVRSGYQPV